MKKLTSLLLPFFLLIFQYPAMSQVQNWYHQDFSSDLGGWSEPGKSPNPPSMVQGDNPYLRNESSGGGGAGSKWLMINTSAAWTGNYTEAGVKYVSMDIRQQSEKPMQFRFSFSNDGGANFTSTKPVMIMPGDDWQKVWFSIEEDDLEVNQGGNKENIMKNVNTVRFLSHPDPSWKGEAIAATVDIDNIQMTGDIDYKVFLTGENQLPAVESDGYGVLYLNEDNDSLTVWGSLSGIHSGVNTSIAGGMHIHAGMAGRNGPVIFPLQATFGSDMSSAQVLPENNRFALTPDQKEMLDDHGLYVNVHSMDFQSGEIRGQILEGDEELFRANLHGSNENPAILSPAEGRIVMELDSSNQLTLSGSFQNLSSELATALAGGGHIHAGLPGVNGGVEIPLTIIMDSTGTSGILRADDNEYELTADQMDRIRNRTLYINIHSQIYQSGEIRGQVVSAASRKLFRAYLSGTNEVPMVTSSALGTVNVEILSRDSMLVFGSYRNLGSPLKTSIAGGIHLHGGMAGENAGVLFPLVNTQSTTTDGQLETKGYGLDSATYSLIMNRSTYINVHTEAYGGGEIRGQVLSDAPWHFTAPMTSSQELSTAISNGYGSMKAEWNGNQLIVSGVVQGLSSPIATNIAGGGHIHMEMPGMNGGVVFPLNLDITEDGLKARIQADSNVYFITDTIALAMARRGLYANIHTENYRSGELRGQLLFDAAMYHAAVLQGALENPPVNTPAKGLALLEVNPQSFHIVGTVSGLTSAINTNIAGGAHLHNGYAGLNGPVITPIVINPDAEMTAARIPVMENWYPLPDPGMDVLRLRTGYVNFHTIAHPSGEVRGQILPLSSYYLIANLSGHNEAPPVDSSGMGTVVAEVNGNKATLSGTFNALTGKVAVNIAGGAHIHQAAPGNNGPVIVPLNIDLSSDSLSGEFNADSNTADAGNNNLLAMVWNGLYVNVHSQNYPAGEVRGQLLPMINYFPDADSVILTSADEITLDTTHMDTRVVFDWSDAIDQDPLAYQMEWSADSTFDTVIFRSQYSPDSRMAVGDSTLLDTLMAMGYFTNSDTACVMVRLRATDGSLSERSPVYQICFILGVRTNQEDPLQSVVQISPVPARQEINIQIKNYKEFQNQPEVNVAIYNTSGQLMKQLKFRIYGTQHHETIDIHSLPVGQYYLQLNRAVWPFIKL